MSPALTMKTRRTIAIAGMAVAAIVLVLIFVIFSTSGGPSPNPSPEPGAETRQLYVSPTGSDTGDGSQAAPLRTIQAALDEVEAEFRAQIRAVLAAHLRPSHLDWHCLADGGRADIFAMTLRLAREYGLALRIHHQSSAEHCRRAGLPTTDHGVLDSFALGSVHKAARYAQLVRALPAGLSEWAVHPSLGDAEAQALHPERWPVRKADFDFLISREARAILDEEGIVLVDYRPLQQLWAR